MVEKLLYTPTEACRLLNMSRSKLYQEMDAERLSWGNNGRRRFIHRDELERYASMIAPRGMKSAA